MEYSDEPNLSAGDYEAIAKAYANELQHRGFRIIAVDTEEAQEMLVPMFGLLYSIKSCLFSLGGFLGTGDFYSLNERQIKKLSVLLDFDEHIEPEKAPRDKTRCLLKFLSYECELIRSMLKYSENCPYEKQMRDMVDARLSLLSRILT